MDHTLTRYRYDLKRRQLVVQDVQRLSPGMQRIVLTGADMADFESMAPDDHVKLFFAGADGAPTGRDYTPRAFDNKAQTLTIDFALHEQAGETGPATAWAMNAKIGDELSVGGPRGSTLVPYNFDWWLLIGDETALPAIGRRLEEVPAGTRVISLITVGSAAEQQDFKTNAQHELTWLHRPAKQAHTPDMLLAALKALKLPHGDGFVWIATEGMVARAVRAYLVDERAHPLAWTKSSGYWVQGTADAHDEG